MQAITESTTGSTIAVMEKSTTNKQLEPRPPAGIFLRIEQALPEESNGIGAHAKKVRDQREREGRTKEGRGENECASSYGSGEEGGPLGYYKAWKPPNTWRRRGGGLGPPPSQSGASHAAAAPDGGCSRWKK